MTSPVSSPTLIEHNGQHISRSAARQQLHTGGEQLMELEDEQAHIADTMQTLLRRRNSVYASYQRTGRLMYKCELHSLDRSFEVHCVEMRSVEERCMELEHELSVLEAKVRRAERRERYQQRRAKKLLVAAKSDTEATGDVSMNISGSSFSSNFSASSSLSDSLDAAPELAEAEQVVGATGTGDIGTDWTEHDEATGSVEHTDDDEHKEDCGGGCGEEVDATVPSIRQSGSEEASSGDAESNSDENEYEDDEEDDFDEDVFDVSFYGGLSTSV